MAHTQSNSTPPIVTPPTTGTPPNSAPSRSPTAQHRLPGLDGLRGVAVLMVVISHVSSYHAELLGPAGVALFFAISGYLITLLLLREQDQLGRISLPAFYARRGLRLFPALLGVVLLTPLLLWATGDPRLPHILGGLVTAVAYVQDFAGATGHFGILAHAWSLSVEEQFYLIWPLCLVLAAARAGRAARLSTKQPSPGQPSTGQRSTEQPSPEQGSTGQRSTEQPSAGQRSTGQRRTRRSGAGSTRLARIAAGACLAAAIWHALAVSFLSYDWTYYAPDTNAVFLLTGCALATSQRVSRRGAIRPSIANGALLVMILLPLAFTRIPVGDWRLSTALMYPVELLAVVVLLGAAGMTVLRTKVLVWFGRISYGLYLWNYVLISLEPGGRTLTGRERLIAAFAAVGMSAASWYLVESPVLRLKKRYQRVAGDTRVVDLSRADAEISVELRHVRL